MRLLITADAAGGVWDYVASLTSALESRRHAVLLAVIGDPSAAQLEVLPERIAIECRDYRLEWMPDAATDLRPTAEWIARLARGWGARALHLNQLVYGGLVRFEMPTVVVVHSDVGSWFREVEGTTLPADWTTYREMVTAGLAAASAVVAPTHYQADLTTDLYGRRVDRVIPNGFDPAPLPSRPPKEPLVVCAGRAWDPAKGIAILDRAVSLLAAKAPALRLFGPLVGPGGARFEPRHLVHGGTVSRAALQHWMARATVYAAPSLYEPFGLAPLEAAREGCALVLSDIASFRELWDGCAVFVRRGDAAALAEALERLLADPAEAARLGEAAAARAQERYGAARCAAAYEELYASLASPAAAVANAPTGMAG